MSDDAHFYNEFFQGLKALAETAFPKKCINCGRSFETVDQFLSETRAIGDLSSGLKQSEDDDGSKIVEAFRNCTCGSTLMEFFGDRRDLSEKGEQRRKRFGELIEFIVSNSIDRQIARIELLKVMRGEKSDILAKIKPPEK